MFLRTTLALTTTIVLAACGGGGSSSPTVQADAPANPFEVADVGPTPSGHTSVNRNDPGCRVSIRVVTGAFGQPDDVDQFSADYSIYHYFSDNVSFAENTSFVFDSTGELSPGCRWTRVDGTPPEA